MNDLRQCAVRGCRSPVRDDHEALYCEDCADVLVHTWSHVHRTPWITRLRRWWRS